jgi:two-component system OmpR family response regulator
MSPDAQGRRILVVEDDPLVLELITTRLELANYQTFLARDGHEALLALARVRPAGMILDINMPRLDGFGVLRKMSRAGQLRRIPTLVLTARNQAEDVKTAIQLGARDFLSKPFQDKQLLSRVARLLRKPAAAPKPDAGAIFLV